MARADDRAHRREVLVDVLAQLFGPQPFRGAGEVAHIGKQNRQLGVPRLHVVPGRIARHLGDVLWRRVLAEATDDLALGA